MAQNAHIPVAATTKLPGKVETRLSPTGVSMREASIPQASAILDADGRVVPMAAINVEAVHPSTGCASGHRMRPAEIRKIAEAEAEKIGLPQDLVSAVIRAEGLVGANTSAPGVAMLNAGSGEASCADRDTHIRKAVAHLARMRQLYPAPVHHLTAYREGEEAFLASRGIPERSETLRFVVTAMNELATPPSELAASNPPKVAKKSGVPATLVRSQVTAIRAPQTGHPDPRWVSGFVFNLE